MAEYRVILKDRDGYDIVVDLIDGLRAAKQRSRYLLSSDYACNVGTTQDDLGSYKVEVQHADTGECLWDMFR